MIAALVVGVAYRLGHVSIAYGGAAYQRLPFPENLRR
jgi:hypothetical protein